MSVSMLYNGSKYYLYEQVGSLRIVSNSSHDIVKEIVYVINDKIITIVCYNSFINFKCCALTPLKDLVLID